MKLGTGEPGSPKFYNTGLQVYSIEPRSEGDIARGIVVLSPGSGTFAITRHGKTEELFNHIDGKKFPKLTTPLPR